MSFLILLFITHIFALDPRWQQTPHIQTMTVIYATGVNCGIGNTGAYSYSLYNITRTFDTANDNIKGFVSVSSYSVYTAWSGSFYYYNYYRHYVSVASLVPASITFYVDFDDYCVGHISFQVMLYTKQVQLSIQHVTHSITSVGTSTGTASTYSYILPFTPIFTSGNTLILIPYLTGIYMVTSSFTSILTTRFINHTHFQANYNFNAKTIYAVWSTFLCIDRTLLQYNRTLFVDHYYFKTGNTAISSFWGISQKNFITGMTYPEVPCRNKMYGYAGFTASSSYPTFTFHCPTYTSVSTSGITSFQYSVINFRVRVCDSGVPYYNQITGKCVANCPIRNYVVPTHLFCQPCPILCLTCNDDGILCLSCSATIDFRILTSMSIVNGSKAGRCDCIIGYFDDGNVICNSCHSSCLTCSIVSTQCTQCKQKRVLKSDFTCPCIAGYIDTVFPPNCTQHCGDGIRIQNQQCDDMNPNLGDGCTTSCIIQPNYSCRQLNSTSPSTCSYNQPLLFAPSPIIVDNISFTISTIVTITPPYLPWMLTFDFSSLVSNDTNVNIASASYSTSGTILYTFSYSNLSDGNVVAFTFNTPNTQTSFAIPSSNFTFNIPALIEPIPIPPIPGYLSTVTRLLIGITIVNLLVYIIGGLKLAYVQTMWTLQISYFCLLGSYIIQPLQQVFKVINVAANGYNRMYFGLGIETNFVFPELTMFDYKDEFLSNVNVMLIIQLSIIIISTIFYGLAKIKHFKKGKNVLMMIHSFLLYDITLSLVMFNIMNSSFAMGLQVIFFLEKGILLMSFLNIIEMILSFSVTIISVCLFIFRNNQFVNNIGTFKHDKRSRLQPLVMLGVRFAMGFTMGILYRHWYSGLVVIAIQIGYGISISVRNPYTLVFLLRAILNQGTILQNLLVGFLYKAYRINQNDKGGLVPLWIQTFLLGVTCLTSLFYMVYTIYKKILKIKNQNKIQIQDNLRFGPGQTQRKVQRMVELDHNLTNQSIIPNNIQISEIGFFDGRSINNKKMKGQEY